MTSLPVYRYVSLHPRCVDTKNHQERKTLQKTSEVSLDARYEMFNIDYQPTLDFLAHCVHLVGDVDVLEECFTHSIFSFFSNVPIHINL